MEQTLPSSSAEEDDQLLLFSLAPKPTGTTPTHAQELVAMRFGYVWRDGEWIALPLESV